MDTGKQIGKSIAALVLLCALMFPTALQFSHIFEGHEQIDCKEQSTHIHEYVADCQICDFHLASFNYDLVFYSEPVAPPIPFKVEKYFSFLLIDSFKKTNTQLRAPPHFLS